MRRSTNLPTRDITPPGLPLQSKPHSLRSHTPAPSRFRVRRTDDRRRGCPEGTQEGGETSKTDPNALNGLPTLWRFEECRWPSCSARAVSVAAPMVRVLIVDHPHEFEGSPEWLPLQQSQCASSAPPSGTRARGWARFGRVRHVQPNPTLRTVSALVATEFPANREFHFPQGVVDPLHDNLLSVTGWIPECGGVDGRRDRGLRSGCQFETGRRLDAFARRSETHEQRDAEATRDGHA